MIPFIFTCGIILSSIVITFQHIAHAEISQDRKIEVLNSGKSENEPTWKEVWDSAREASKNEDYLKALSVYENLFQIKPNIEVAKYEYSKLLFKSDRFQDAVKVLQSLIENNPTKPEYLLLIAQCHIKNEQHEKAGNYFSKLYNNDPYGKLSIPALEGLINSLKAQNKSEFTIPLLKQLVLRKPEKALHLYSLASLLNKYERKEEAKSYYLTLLKKFRVNEDVLLEAEELLKGPEDHPELLNIWLQYLQIRPDHLPFREKVANFYINDGDDLKALDHLLYIDENSTVSNSQTTILIANIYFKKLRRPDKALSYYERYLRIYPEDTIAQQHLQSAQLILANDFISIVQNDGAALLWDDLKNVTDDRRTLFLVMIGLLQEAGENEKYLEMLKLLHTDDASDEEVTLKIVSEMCRVGQFDNGLSYLKKIKYSDISNKQFFSNLEQVLRGLGVNRLAYLSYEYFISRFPDSIELNIEAFALAVNLDYFDKARKHFNIVNSNDNITNLPFAELSLFLQFLVEYGEYSTVLNDIDRLIESSLKKDARLIKLVTLKTSIFEVQEEYYLAEEQLRRNIVSFPDHLESYSNLIRFHIDRENFEEARKWFRLTPINLILSKKKKIQSMNERTMHFLFLEILIGEKEYDEALEYIQSDISTSLNSDSTDTERENLKTKKAELLYLQGAYYNSWMLAQELLEDDPHNLMAFVISKNIHEKRYLKLSFDNSLEPQYGYSTLETENDLIKVVEMQERLGHINQSIKDLLIARGSAGRKDLQIKIAQFFDRNEVYKSSLEFFEGLKENDSDEPYFNKKIVDIQFKLGNFDNVLQILSLQRKNISIPTAKVKFQDGLYIARSLWMVGERDESLTVYKRLIDKPVAKKYETKMLEKNIYTLQLPRNRSFWNVLTFSDPNNIEDVDILMEPDFLVRNLNDPIVNISNDLFVQYQWEKIVKEEKIAKNALLNRDYFYAENRYKELLEKVESEEVLLDLASIYHRLGKYSQEAEVYERIVQDNTGRSDLSERVAKNKESRKPKATARYLYISEEGRDFYKNIKSNNANISLWIEPFIDHTFDIAYDYTTFSSQKNTRDIETNQLFVSYNTHLSDNYEVKTGLGAIHQGSSSTATLYQLEIKGKIDNNLQGFVSVEQDIVKDTLHSIEEGVLKRDYGVGFIIDSIPKTMIGGDIIYRQYSQDNSQEILNLWSSYSIYKEDFLFRFQYDFESIFSERENTFTYDYEDLSYWSPNFFWQHALTCHFEYLLSYNNSFGGAPGYISAEYSLGYENNENTTHRGEVNIFLEMSRYILLKGSLEVFSTENYDSQEGMLSLVYRW